MSFRLKTILGIAFIEGALLLLLVWMGLNLIQSSQEEALSTRATTIAKLFATTSKDPVLSSDLASLESFTDEVMKNPGLRYARVLDARDEVLTQRTRPGTEAAEAGVEVFEAQADIREGGERYGRVEIGLGAEGLAELLRKARSNASALAIIEMSLVALFSFVLGTWLTHQIKALELAARRVSSGDLGHQVPVKGNDELARTTRAFNRMSSDLQRLYAELGDANKELEGKVRARSSELQLVYKVSEMLVDMTTPLDQVFAETVNAIAATQSTTGKNYTRILFDGKSYESADYDDGEVAVSTDIVIGGETRGSVQIVCIDVERPCDKARFERNKKPLLEAVTKNLSTMIAHRMSLQEKQAMEIQLRHAQKLESVGQLAAGIAHEINTPTQFVNDNTHFLKDAFTDYRRLIERYRELLSSLADAPEQAEQLAAITELEQELDIEYLDEETPQAIAQSIDGLQRIGRIVKAMKEFSHPGTDEKVPMNLREQIETTIDVSRNEWKYCCALETEFDADLPTVPGLPDEFKQVILNLVVNAAHAIEETGREDGRIRITTAMEDDNALVTVSDNGCGIPKEIRERVFDPFFTTKEVGKGTGQGLTIAYSIIVDKHAGQLDLVSKEGEGTRFEIRLPLMAA